MGEHLPRQFQAGDHVAVVNSGTHFGTGNIVAVDHARKTALVLLGERAGDPMKDYRLDWLVLI